MTNDVDELLTQIQGLGYEDAEIGPITSRGEYVDGGVINVRRGDMHLRVYWDDATDNEGWAWCLETRDCVKGSGPLDSIHEIEEILPKEG